MLPVIVMAGLALLTAATSPGVAFAEEAKVRVTSGWGFGHRTVTAPGNDATRPDITGFTAMAEANLFVEGGDGVLEGRFQLRLRGREQQTAEQDLNTFADDEAQTIRGHVRWKISGSWRLMIAKAGAVHVNSLTENDPVQSLPCACLIGNLTDEGFIDLEYISGGFELSFSLSPSTPDGLTTNGLRVGIPGGGGLDADSNNQSFWIMVKARTGELAIHAKLVTASGEQDNDADPTTLEFSGIATAITVHVIIPLGDSKLKLDFESGRSDLDPTLGPNGGATEEEILYTGILWEMGGLFLAYGQGSSEVGATEATQTNLAVHYRFPLGKGWIAPEFAMQTREDITSGPAEEEITVLRLMLMHSF